MDNNNSNYEDVCMMCHRTESKAGRMVKLPGNLCVCEDCMNRSYDLIKNMGLDKQEIDRRIKETAKLVGLPASLLDKSPFELSGGQKRRVAIAGVMAMEPKVLILDEPASGLDPKGREQILGLIKEYHKEKKNTVVLVSHSMEDIAKHTTKILVMNKAKLFCYDDTVKVFHRAKELEQMGLAVPQITRVFNRLKAMGVEINDDVYTTKYAKELLLKLLADKKITARNEEI